MSDPAISPAPRFSVVMPSFNHQAFVAAAISSVLAQSVGELELIVIDDASTDATWEVIQGFSDPRIRALRHPENRGAHATLNEALSMARGDILAIINSDDIYAPERLARCAELIDQGQALVGSDIALIGDDDEQVTEHWWLDAFGRLKATYRESGDWVATLLEGNVFMTTSNFVMTRACWQAAGPFRDLRFVHDFDFLLTALQQRLPIGWIDTPLLRYRIHPGNTISENPLNANLEASRLLREHAPKLIASSDLDARRLAHLCSQLGRNERYVDEIHKALRHHALVDQEQRWRAMIEDRDRWIGERDQWIAQRDGMIADRERWIADRDRWIAEREQNIHKLGADISMLNTLVEQRDGWIAERDRMLRLRETEVHDLRFSRSYRLGHALLAPVRVVTRLAGRIGGGTGNPRRVRHLSALRRHLESDAPRLACVSFDIFDTLVGRCVEPPELVHRRVAEALAERLGPGYDTARVEQARRDQETDLRHAALADGNDHECHFDPLVAGWIRRLCGEERSDLVEFVQALELELETLALFVKPGVRELIEWLHSKGIRAIAVSDMYLGHDHLVHLLEGLGIGGLIDRVYVSAEFGLGKYSGRLHAKVLEAEGLGAEQMAHVGDNLHSDALAPARLGLRSYFLDDRRERNRRRDQSLSAEMSGSGGIWPGRQFFEIIATRIANSPASHREDFFFRYGRDVLGPAFCTFTLGLCERLGDFAPERVFFLARDGHLFQRIYESWQACGFGGSSAPASYAYASRRVVSSAAVADGMSHQQAIVAFYNPKQQGLLSVLKTYGLPPDEFADAAREHGLEPIEAALTDWEDPRLHAFLADEAVQQRIRRHGTAAKDQLYGYFAQLGLLSCRRVALVDIGWNGTIQKFMQQSFGDLADYPEVRGYYFALVTGMHGQFDGSDKLEGLILDARRGDPFERAPFDFEELFEQGARSQEATTIGYARDGAQVKPILKPDSAPDRQGELACNPAIAALQDGVLCHAAHFIAAQRLTGHGFDALKPYVLGQLERAVAYPTAEEAAHIRGLVHTEDFGHDHVLALGGAPLDWLDFLRPRKLREKLHLSPWPNAQAAHLPSGLANWLLRLVQLHKVRKREAGRA